MSEPEQPIPVKPVEQPQSEQPVEQPPAEQPPAEQPPVEQPPAEQPPAEQPEEIPVPKKEKGPYEVDEDDFTPRFVRVMQKEGITTSELMPKTRKDVIDLIRAKDPLGSKINEELVNALARHLETKRIQRQQTLFNARIDLIRKERSSVIIPQRVAMDQSMVTSQLNKSIVSTRLNKSVESGLLNKSILQVSPDELEFKIYDKIQKRERGKIHKAIQQEKILIKQEEHKHKLEQLDARLEKHQLEKQRKRKIEKVQKKQVQEWLHDNGENLHENNEKEHKKQVYFERYKEHQELLHQKQLLDPVEKVEKVTSKNDIKRREKELLLEKREQELVKRLEHLGELAGKLGGMNEFTKYSRELWELIKMEKQIVRKQQMEEYQEQIKLMENNQKNEGKMKIVRNLTLINLNQQVKVADLRKKHTDLEQRLEHFQRLEEEDLKKKMSGEISRQQYFGSKSQNTFTLMKMEYEKRRGFEEDMIMEIDRVDNIVKRKRKDEQIKIDIINKKQAQAQDPYEVERKLEIIKEMKKAEIKTQRETNIKLDNIKTLHNQRGFSISKEQIAKQEQDEVMKNKKNQEEYEMMKEKYKVQIEEERQRIQKRQEQKQKEQLEQESG